MRWLFIFLLVLAACSSLQSSLTEKPIIIGYIGPLTGDAAGFGADTVNGAKLALAEINNAGGIQGRQISLIAEDGRCNAADAASAAQKLIAIDRVSAIIGGQCSSETLGIAPIAEKAMVPVISPVSSIPDITHSGDFIFRVYPSDARKGTALSNYFRSAGYKKIAIISENTDFCIGVKDALRTSLKDGELIVFDEVVEPGTKDYRTLLTRLKELDFDVFLANGQSPTTVAAMVQQLREINITQPIVGTDTSDSVSLGAIAKDSVEGMKALSVPSLNVSDPKAEPFIRAYMEKYGDPQIGLFFSALSYEATKILLHSIKESGENGSSIRDSLYGLKNYESIIGSLSFDKNGDVLGIPYALKEFKNGKLVEVERIPLE